MKSYLHWAGSSMQSANAGRRTTERQVFHVLASYALHHASKQSTGGAVGARCMQPCRETHHRQVQHAIFFIENVESASGDNIMLLLPQHFAIYITSFALMYIAQCTNMFDASSWRWSTARFAKQQRKLNSCRLMLHISTAICQSDTANGEKYNNNKKCVRKIKRNSTTEVSWSVIHSRK